MGLWNKFEDARLTKLFNQGMTYTAIGSKLGRSKNSVASRVQRLELDTSSRQQREKPQIRANTKKFYDSCQWPIGDPGDANFKFCGAPVARGSYCEEHYQRAYQSSEEAA